MNCTPAKALELADRAQAVCDAQHGAGDRCCLMREVAEALRELAGRIVALERTLNFYANGTHYSGDEWDDVTGEPPNWLCNPHGDTIEDGSIAKAALETPPRYLIEEASGDE